MEVFIVGKNRDEHQLAWEFVGVFSTREKAIAACVDVWYFVGPAEIDAPEGGDEWPGAFRPHSPHVERQT